MSAPQRQLQITYGTVTASGTLSGSTLTLYGVHNISKTADTFSVGYNILVTADTEALLRAGCASLEEAMTTRRQDLTVKTLTAAGAVDQTLLSLSHTGNTGLNITAEISKPGGDNTDTSLSRLYGIVVSGELPTKTALAGLRTFDYDVSLSPSRKGTLTVRGSYTAVSSTQAIAQYQASIAARVTSITTALTGTWELTEESYTPDDTDQVVNFSRTYKELIFNEANSTLNKTQIVDQALAIRTDRIGSEGLKEERKLATITAAYSCAVDKNQTQNLQNLWDTVVRPWIVKNIEDVADTSNFAIVSQSPDFDYVENRINATVTAQASTGSKVIARTVTCTDDVETGRIFAKTWPIESGTKYPPAYVYSGPGTRTRTIVFTETTIGDPDMPRTSGGSGGGGGLDYVAGFGGKPGDVRIVGQDFGMFGIGATRPGESILSFSGPGGVKSDGKSGGDGKDGDFDTSGGFLIRYSETQSPRTIGLKGEQLSLTDSTSTAVYEFVTDLSVDLGGTRV